jgi:hypothetical protein
MDYCPSRNLSNDMEKFYHHLAPPLGIKNNVMMQETALPITLLAWFVTVYPYVFGDGYCTIISVKRLHPHVSLIILIDSIEFSLFFFFFFNE